MKQFLDERPEFLNLKIYDLDLTTGKLLYSCAGGIGVSKERYMVEMNSFIMLHNSAYLLEKTFKRHFGDSFGYRKYVRLKCRFNEKRDIKLKTPNDCAELYCLWSASDFVHRYLSDGYDGHYMPRPIDYEGVFEASVCARDRQLEFRREDFLSFRESVITDDMVLYVHMPYEYRQYGCRMKWTSRDFEDRVRIMNELHHLGYRVCISAEYERRGLILRDYPSLFPEFSHIVISPFKSIESGVRKPASEIYLLNF